MILNISFDDVRVIEYTEEEGGRIRAWSKPWQLTAHFFHHIDTRKKRPFRIFGPSANDTVKIHSAKFEDGRWWDTVNGWRDRQSFDIVGCHFGRPTHGQ